MAARTRGGRPKVAGETMEVVRFPTGRRLRVSVDNPNLSPFKGLTLIPPPMPEQMWRARRLDAATLDKMSPTDLLSLLRTLSPDISRAIWDFLRMMNPGYVFHAFRPGTQEEDPQAMEALQAFIHVLEDLYGSFDVVVGRINMGAFMRGAFLAELVLDQAGRMPVDIATPDPRWFAFDMVTDAVRGQIYRLIQYQPMGGVIDLSIYPTIRYVPVDAMPGSPYGEGLAPPALGTTIFMLAILHDLRRVVQQQGWPRVDLKVLLEEALKQMPADYRGDAKATKKWLDNLFDEIAADYGGLEPDDAYLHSDVVEVNQPVGAVDTSSLGAINGLIGLLERQQVRGLKTMPILFGINEGATETHANRQWEVHVAGIKALQHLHESLLKMLFRIALRVQGIQADVEFMFSELRAAELLRDAQVSQITTQVAMFKYQAGWISHAEAAQEGAGKKVPDQPAPRVKTLGAGTPGSAPGEPGAGRDPGRVEIAIRLLNRAVENNDPERCRELLGLIARDLGLGNGRG